MWTAGGSSSWAKASTSTSVMNCGIATPCGCTWSAIIRSAACLPTATAAPTIESYFLRPRAHLAPVQQPRLQEIDQPADREPEQRQDHDARQELIGLHQ